jgi:hypothetical protein
MSLAFSNNKILAFDREFANQYVSSNNGTSWSALSPGFSNTTSIVSYGFGTWLAVQTLAGTSSVYFSNASTVASGNNWVSAFTSAAESTFIDDVDYDGTEFVFSAPNNPFDRLFYKTPTALTSPALSDPTYGFPSNVTSPQYTRRMGHRLLGSLEISNGTSTIATLNAPTSLYASFGRTQLQQLYLPAVLCGWV